MGTKTLIINSTDGITSATIKQIEAFKGEGVTEIKIEFTNTGELDDVDLLDLMEMEVREALSSKGYNGDDAVITRS